MTPESNRQAGWTEKNATLTEKTAQKEYGLSAAEILTAINAGKLQYRQISMYGNPALRLLRHEVEALISEKHGADYLKQKQLKTELAEVNKTLRALKSQTLALETRKAEIMALLNNQEL
ncbi:MAG: hypothetical protein NT121_14505 [Chloroflexi bacterium]|nr:hypothetical protein [Chloroflexota bacterium]